MEQGYKIDRKAASRLLKVSMRTVDRYVKDRKLSTRSINGRIWLNRDEISQLKAKNNVDTVDTHMSIDNDVDKVDTVELLDDQNLSTLSTHFPPKKTTNTYKKLFEEAQEDLKEKQERLEIANYRVGQLEAQLKNSIPLLEYHRESYSRQKEKQEAEEKLTAHLSVIEKFSIQLRQEKLIKRISIALLLLILALQPLWLLVTAFV